MCDAHDHDAGRRDLLKLAGALGLAGLAGPALGASREPCAGDGTPLQFSPRTPPDPTPLTDELKKYPKCPYCGMDRTEYQHSRHLVQYEDDLVDGTCSIHCLAVSLALNLDRGPKALYAADFGTAGPEKPLIPVEGATYLTGSKLKGTMSAVSKLAFKDKATAERVRAEQGGEIGDFDGALGQTYAGMAKDTQMIRRMRAEKRRKAMERQAG